MRNWQRFAAGLLLAAGCWGFSGCGGAPAEVPAEPVSESEMEENMKMGEVPNDG